MEKATDIGAMHDDAASGEFYAQLVQRQLAILCQALAHPIAMRIQLAATKMPLSSRRIRSRASGSLDCSRNAATPGNAGQPPDDYGLLQQTQQHDETALLRLLRRWQDEAIKAGRVSPDDGRL